MTSDRSWQRILAAAVRDPAVLLARLSLPADLLSGARRAAAAFPLLVPQPYLDRIQPGDPDDPLLRQVLPLDVELAPQPPGFSCDPLDESEHRPLPGLLRKYHDRVLLLATPACAAHCRYCFRRHFPHGPAARWREALAYVAERPDIHEVIWSGGDPLVLPDQELARQARAFAALPHISRLRWHTRLPVLIPERIDAACAWLGAVDCSRVVVLHCNHPGEIDAAVAAACRRLRAAGCRVRNQAVFLRGVNDEAPVLAALCRRLLAVGVEPYYLHLLDPVSGAAHFLVPVARAVAVMRALATILPASALPRLVREVPGRPGKVPVDWRSSSIDRIAGGDSTMPPPA